MTEEAVKTTFAGLFFALSHLPPKTMASSIASQEPHFVGKHSPTSSSLSISIGAAPSTCECSDPERALTPQISRMSHDHAMSMKAASVGTTGTTDPNFEVDWEDESDIENPKNWPTWYELDLSFSGS